MLEDAIYYSRREAVERGLAQASAEPRVRDVHLQLADRYGALARRAMAAMPNAAAEPAESHPSNVATIFRAKSKVPGAA